MSQYLNFYLKLKNSEEPPKLLASYSRSANIYNYFTSVKLISSDSSKEYTKLTKDIILDVKEFISNEIKETNDNLKYMTNAFNAIKKREQYDVSDFIEDYSESEKYIDELKSDELKLEFLIDIFEDINLDVSDFEGIYMAIG